MADPVMEPIARYSYSRTRACICGVCMGIGMGVFNSLYPLIDFAPSARLYGLLALAIGVTIVLHEGVHGLVAVALGHRPEFGVRPPFVYTTFSHRIPRNRFMLIVIAPLVVLDIAGAVLFACAVAPTFAYLVIAVNTIGSLGDVWMTIYLLKHDRGVLVQDTQTGIEVWEGGGEAGPG